MDVLEPIEPDEGQSPVTPPSLAHPLGDPYAVPTPSSRRRRLLQALAATALVAGVAGAAIGVGFAGTRGRATLTIQPAASTGSSGSSSSNSADGSNTWKRPGFRLGNIIAGTVSKVSGNTITVTTPFASQTATITTNGKTVYKKIVLGKVSDIKAQQTVAVVGTTAANGHLTASYVAIIPPGLLKPAPAGATPPKRDEPAEGAAPPEEATPPPGAPQMRFPAIVVGQVSSVNGTSFVVTRRDGTKVTVETTNTTKVIEEASAVAGDVVPNAHIVAIGTRDSSGAFTASQIVILPADLSGQNAPGFAFGGPLGLPFGLPFGPGGPGMRFGHGFGHGWGSKGPTGQPGGSGSGTSGSGSAPATPQSVSV